MGSHSVGAWKVLLAVSALVLSASILSLPSLYTNISGDGVPNRPQREPPVQYQWDQAAYRIILATLSALVGAYSWKKLER